MTGERDAFVRSVADSPEDDTTRLVFADWLEEHGEETRARFIRAQCEAARFKPGSGVGASRAILAAQLFRREWLSEELPDLATRGSGATPCGGAAVVLVARLGGGPELPLRVRWRRGFA